MGPALQRLLSRPSSLDFLRCLLGPPPVITYNRRRCRKHTNAATLAVDTEAQETRSGYGHYNEIEAEESASPMIEHGNQRPDVQNAAETSEKVSNNMKLPILSPGRNDSFDRAPTIERVIRGKRRHNRWDYWDYARLDFESALDQPTGHLPRLLERSDFVENKSLWVTLLSYRKRTYGAEGVAVIWRAFRARRPKFLETQAFTSQMWSCFLQLGFHDANVFGEIIEYADELWDPQHFRRGNFYCHIIQHLLTQGHGSKAVHFHILLSESFCPSPVLFAHLCRDVVQLDGDIGSLETIYRKHISHAAYSQIVPALSRRKDFKLALRWHFLCLKHQDLPIKHNDVKPLLRFLHKYDVRSARLVNESLVKAGFSFPSSVASKSGKPVFFSREIMNELHGEILNVPAKTYNDELGARWFASTWISLDVAMSSVHALGMDKIGPLSLQAIAVREPDAVSVASRISQLRSLGISIGDSVFSRAVDKFSRNRDHENLESLLKSDLHPDALEDSDLQERLLLSYARDRDWRQFHRTFEILMMCSRHPAATEQNLMLRVHALERDTTAMSEALSTMQGDFTFVKVKTVFSIVRSILSLRRTSKRPPTQYASAQPTALTEVKVAVHLLKELMASGNFVPVQAWTEILRRLGMMGHLEELWNLSLLLTSLYGSNGGESLDVQRFSTFARLHQVPSQISSSHRLHPLRILFPPSFQRAVVEWSFIQALAKCAVDQSRINQPIPNITSGITFLKRLHSHGVQIDADAVRAAVMDRFVIYFGPSTSNRKYNRLAKDTLHMLYQSEAMNQMAKQIDGALGHRLFASANLPRLVASKAEAALRRKRRKELIAIPASVRRQRRRVKHWYCDGLAKRSL